MISVFGERVGGTAGQGCRTSRSALPAHFRKGCPSSVTH
ncbi:hypothetical protein RISK_000734 [Rhodopirellula islandica]|uniref:Uncharacterized protein n=1 Tax=Rhodopirellula islandica TaxID=595434 RepID=A0A0J1BKJ8_RHOIS|nr:hypothetical protein RISK_000734 [Rhodopirellula islandica]